MPLMNQAPAQDPNSVQGVLQKLLTTQTDNRDQLKQQQQTAQQSYRDVLGEPLPDIDPVRRMVSDYLQRYSTNTSQRWNAMAGAIGAEAGRQQDMDVAQQARRENAAKLGLGMSDTNLKEEDAYTAKLMAAAARSGKMGAGGSPVVKMDKDGNMVVYDPSTQETKVVHASQRGEYQRIWTSAYQKAVSNEMEDPEGYAHTIASQVLSASPGFNPQKSAIPSSSSTVPSENLPPIPTGITPSQAPQAAPAPSSLAQGQAQWNANGPRNVELIKQEMARPENQTPDKQLIFKQELEAEMAKQGQAPVSTATSAAPQVAPSTPTPVARGMEYKDPRVAAQQKGYGGKEGEGLYKERQALTDLSGANTKLLGQLDALEQIYANPNIPQGELANLQQQVRSGLVTLGVPGAKEVGVTDFAKALGTSLSLTQKNADGQNLLPGAMSNYEDQLLQKMAPTLSLTNEGRVMLVQFMKQVAAANLRMAQEGTKMAAANKDMLPPNWYERKERIMREEMAKLRLLSSKMIQNSGAQ